MEMPPPPVYRDVAEEHLATLRRLGASAKVIAIAEEVLAKSVLRPILPQEGKEKGTKG